MSAPDYDPADPASRRSAEEILENDPSRLRSLIKGAIGLIRQGKSSTAEALLLIALHVRLPDATDVAWAESVVREIWPDGEMAGAEQQSE